jgi:opacity protein-like surface antigen
LSSYGEDSDRAQTRSRAIDPAVATITGRLGRSAFQTLDFVTYGIEVSVSVNEQLRFVGGIEPHSTKRDIPQLLLQEGEPSTQWNTIVPVNAGLQYSFGESMWRPYLGADVLMIPGYVTEVEGVTLEGGRTATGARARGGLDVILADGFALNLNVSYGRWNGKDFDAVQRDLADTGTVPQGSIGTVIRF